MYKVSSFSRMTISDPFCARLKLVSHDQSSEKD